MRHITIKNRHGVIFHVEGKEQGARRTFVVRDQLEVSLLGGFKDFQYHEASRIALDICEEMNIPASQLVTVQAGAAQRPVKRSDKQIKLF